MFGHSWLWWALVGLVSGVVAFVLIGVGYLIGVVAGLRHQPARRGGDW